jgi:hypothetical protein
MAVNGGYLDFRLRHSIRPILYAYGQWVDDHIIPLVEDFEARANAAQQAAFEQISATVNPECADESEVHEQAFDHGLELYQTLSALYQASINLFAVGFFSFTRTETH